jgi:hypothetical protein
VAVWSVFSWNLLESWRSTRWFRLSSSLVHSLHHLDHQRDSRTDDYPELVRAVRVELAPRKIDRLL